MTRLSALPPSSSRALVAAWVRSIRAYYAPCTRRVLVSGGMVQGADLMAHRFNIDADTWRGWERGDSIPRAQDVERLLGVSSQLPAAPPRGMVLLMVHDARVEQSRDRDRNQVLDAAIVAE